MIFHNGEWGIAKIHVDFTKDNLYGYRLLSEYIWGTHDFSINTHGRLNADANRWVLLTSKTT